MNVVRFSFYALMAAMLVPGAFPLSTNALISRVEQHYNKAQTLTVNFLENYSILGRQRRPESGKLTLRKQGKMRWDYSEPAGKIFLSDGKTIYLYSPGDNKVEKIPVKDTDDMRAPLAFLLGHLDLRREFGNFDAQPEGGNTWLKAAAKNDKTPYSSVEMLVDETGAIHKLNITGRDRSQLQFSLTNEEVNPPVSESLFAFKIPAGAEVVDAAGFVGEEQ